MALDLKKYVQRMFGIRTEPLPPIPAAKDLLPTELRRQSHATANTATMVQAVSYRLQREAAALKTLTDELTYGGRG